MTRIAGSVACPNCVVRPSGRTSRHISGGKLCAELISSRHHIRRTALFLALLAAAVGAAPASAVVPATPDGNGHPNVGTMVAEWLTPGVKDIVCSGTLVAPRVFLTAAHCDVRPDGVPADQVYVSFDPIYQPGVSTIYQGTFVPSPDYTNYKGDRGLADADDIAVIRLNATPSITPASLPPAGLLNSLDLRSHEFTAVGYGTTRLDKRKGPNNIVDQFARNVTTQTFRNLLPSWLDLVGDPATGDGITCYGDSGGPHFLDDTDVIVSLTALGDAACRAAEKTYRVDTPSARDFLASEGVPLP